MKRLIISTFFSLCAVAVFGQSQEEMYAYRLAEKAIDRLFYTSSSVNESNRTMEVLSYFYKPSGRLEIKVKTRWIGGMFDYHYYLVGYVYTDIDGCNTKWVPKDWNGSFMAEEKRSTQNLGCVDEEN